MEKMSFFSMLGWMWKKTAFFSTLVLSFIRKDVFA